MSADPKLEVLLAATVGIAFVHTAAGPDHTLPFIALARARGWSLGRTLFVTAACGVGHVLGSLVLGAIGIALGLAVDRFEGIEATRGRFAAWLLIAFGVAYAVHALVRASRGRHGHAHVHGDGTAHVHPDRGHAHAHTSGEGTKTFSALFLVFVLGPCEPLVPLLFAPAATRDAWSTAWVALVFCAVTIATMLAIVAVAHRGLRALSLGVLSTHSDAIAGLTIAMSGLAIVTLGL